MAFFNISWILRENFIYMETSLLPVKGLKSRHILRINPTATPKTSCYGLARDICTFCQVRQGIRNNTISDRCRKIQCFALDMTWNID